MTYSYDNLMRLTEIANHKDSASGAVVTADTFTYDAAHMRTQETVTYCDSLTNAFAAGTVNYSHNAVNQTTASTNPARTYTYDADGNMTHGWSEGGFPMTMTYDAFDRLTGVTLPAPGSGSRISNSFGYDTADNRASVTDGNSHTTAYEYDDFGRMVSTTDAEGHKVLYEYDPAGNLTKMKDPRGSVTQFAYYDDDTLKTKTYQAVGTVTLPSQRPHDRFRFDIDDLKQYPRRPFRMAYTLLPVS